MNKPKKLLSTKELIVFWEAKLRWDKFLMEPSTEVLLINTIRVLKEVEATNGDSVEG